MKKKNDPIKIISVPVKKLDEKTWEEAWNFIKRYTITTRDYFKKKVNEHSELVLYRRTSDGSLAGTAAIDVYDVNFDGKISVVIFTSNVILDEGCRGKNLIQKTGLRYFLRTRVKYPFSPIYWFFDTFSYKSYLLLPKNFNEFWPRFDQNTPTWESGFIDHLSRQRYGDSWMAERGIVLRSEKKQLKDWVAPINDNLLKDPHIKYYFQKNPGYRQGDMLVCLCPLHAKNWGHLIKKMAKRAIGI